MTGKYDPLEKYLRGLPTSQDVVTLSFEFIEQVMNDPLPQTARQPEAGHERRIHPLDGCRLAGGNG